MLPFKVFYYQSLANILSFAAVASKFRITIDTEFYPSINVHIDDGTSIMFKKLGEGLYYFYITNEAFDEGQTTV